MDLKTYDWRKSSRSAKQGNCVEIAITWCKSSRSAENGGDCVEVAVTEKADA